MARAVNRLTARQVQTITRPGRHADGGGLYLTVERNGAKRWTLLATVHGKRREYGLGGLSPANGLKEAREAARQAQEAISRGEDPRKPKTASPSFSVAAEEVITNLKGGWRGAKTEDGWRRNLITHAKDIGQIPVDLISTDDVLDVVRGLWTEKPESGGKLRQRIEVVLDYATAKGWRSGENPARWKGHMDTLLPKRGVLTRGHHKAIEYPKAPEAMQKLAGVNASSARALEWTILTAARESMTLEATWGEVVGDTWIVPAARMKLGIEHRIPLPVQALDVLETIKIGEPDPEALIFVGAKAGRPMSNNTMDKMLRTLGIPSTPHGFRSTFRDWAGDCTDHPREVAEAALAHAIGSKTERSYRRGDALEKRRKLMQDWADFIRPRRPAAEPAPPDE